MVEQISAVFVIVAIMGGLDFSTSSAWNRYKKQDYAEASGDSPRRTQSIISLLDLFPLPTGVLRTFGAGRCAKCTQRLAGREHERKTFVSAPPCLLRGETCFIQCELCPQSNYAFPSAHGDIAIAEISGC